METEWHYRLVEKECGPVSAAELRRLVHQGTIHPDTPVRKADGNWVRARALKGLFPTDADAPSSATIAPSQGPPHNVTVFRSATAPVGPRPVPPPSLGTSGQLWLWVPVGVASVFLCVLFALALNSYLRSRRTTLANQQVASLLDRAQSELQQGRFDEAQQTLTDALAVKAATDKDHVRPLLENVKLAKARNDAASILRSAEAAIQAKDVTAATQRLKEYLAHQHATEKVRAQTLLAEADLVASSTQTTRPFQYWTNFELSAFADTGQLPERRKIDNQSLRDLYIGTLRKSLQSELKRRADEKARTEAEQLAENARREAEQAAENARRQAEDRAERAFAANVDKADLSPEFKYLALTERRSLHDRAAVSGKYATLLKVIHVPKDRPRRGEFDDYGHYGATKYEGYDCPDG